MVYVWLCKFSNMALRLAALLWSHLMGLHSKKVKVTNCDVGDAAACVNY